MSEMTERVAKAIFDAMDITDGLDWTSAERYARAAIEAMREPTVDMIDAAASVDRYAEPGDEWGAMIDAALGKVDA
jgi:hypothetical protein